MTEVMQQPESDEIAADDDRAPYERLWALWKSLDQRRKAVVAGGLAIITAGGLFGGRLLLKDDAEPIQLLPDGTTTASVHSGGQAAGGQPTQEAPNLPAWEAECSKLNVTRTPDGNFVFKPQFVALRGTANPGFTYTAIVSSPPGEVERTGGRYTEAVTSVRWDSPEWMTTRSVTVSPSRLGGAVAVLAITFPNTTHQPPDDQVPPEWGNSFPEAISADCKAPMFAEPESHPTRIVDALGEDWAN